MARRVGIEPTLAGLESAVRSHRPPMVLRDGIEPPLSRLSDGCVDRLRYLRLAAEEGVEPPTPWVTARRSPAELHCFMKDGPGGRTGPPVRSNLHNAKVGRLQRLGLPTCPMLLGVDSAAGIAPAFPPWRGGVVLLDHAERWTSGWDSNPHEDALQAPASSFSHRMKSGALDSRASPSSPDAGHAIGRIPWT